MDSCRVEGGVKFRLSFYELRIHTGFTPFIPDSQGANPRNEMDRGTYYWNWSSCCVQKLKSVICRRGENLASLIIMQIILMTVADHIYGNYVIKRLMDARRDEIVAIIESEVLLYRKSFYKAISKYLRNSGMYYVAAQSVKQESFKVISLLYKLLNIQQSSSIFFSYRTMAKRYSIPVYKTRDINSESILSLIENLSPDLLVSVFFNQILGKELLSMPPSCINIHPAYLPAYRGVSPVFWALANDEPYAGVTIHYIDDGIDTGGIIYQEEIPITPDDTEHSLYFKCCEAGAPLLMKALTGFEAGNVKSVTNENTGASYYSLPRKEAVCQFRKNGRKFYRVRNLRLAFEDYE